jgi:hypothetical protein
MNSSGTGRNLRKIPDDYAAVLGNWVLASQSLQVTLEIAVQSVTGSQATRVIFHGQSADRLQSWGLAMTERVLSGRWHERFRALSIEARRVLDLRNQAVHGTWRVGEESLEAVRFRKGAARIEVMSLDRMRRCLVDTQNVEVDLHNWTANWQQDGRGGHLFPEREGDVLPDGSWTSSGPWPMNDGSLLYRDGVRAFHPVRGQDGDTPPA